MSSARKLTDIPECMRMSFNYPWESSPEGYISDPLSYDLPDITSDFEAIYGEGAAKLFFPQTPPKAKNALPVLQDDSPCADVFLELFGPELTPEPPSHTESSPASSPGYASDPRSLSCTSSNPSPKHWVPGGKKGRQATISNVRALCLPYQRHSPGTPSPSRSDYSILSLSPASLSSSTRSSVSSNPDDVLTPEFMNSLRIRPPGTPMAGPSFLPGGRGPGLHPRRSSKSPMKPQPSPFKPLEDVVVDATQETEVFAHRYCRYAGCDKRFSDKRTTWRHRLTHLKFGTFVCPNTACDSHTKARPHFASDFSLGRHLRLAADNSPCAVGKGKKLSSFKMNPKRVEAMIQQALVPFDPVIHTPF